VLSDYRVLDLSDERGALCGQLLADLGAHVIRVEPPGGSPMRSAAPNELMWQVYARNCDSLAVDLATADGRRRFAEYARNADLVVDNDQLRSLGIDVAELRASNPSLVHVSITAFGDGPKRDYRSTDLIAQAASGAMAITGYHDGKPLRTGAITAWSHAGVAGAGAALLALRSAAQTGRGQDVDVSAQEACNLAASFSLLTAYVGASRIGRVGNVGGNVIPLIWRCKDGFVSMTIGFLGPMLGFAHNLLKWMRAENCIDDALAGLDWPKYMGSLRETGDVGHLTAFKAALGKFFGDRTKNELLDGAIEHGALIVPVSTTHDLLASRQLATRDFWWKANGTTMPGAFAHFSGHPLRLRARAPKLDSHALFRPRARSSAASATTSPLPLAGVKILDFAWVMAGPWSTRVMADYGATVIKVESRTRLDLVRILGPFYGDKFSPETSASFASINAGKRSLELDPGTPEGKTTILELVDWADIVVESFSPKAMKKWGLDYPSLAGRKPNLIMLSTCLFGQTGPHSLMAGYGTMGAALGGLALPTGEPGREPCGPFGPYTDYVAPRFSVVAMLAALHHRDRTGAGQHIDQSQAESAMHYLSLAVARASVSHDTPDRLGNTDSNMFPHDAYRCSGADQWVAIAVRDDADWQALVDAIDAPELSALRAANVAARRASGGAIDAAISRWSSDRSAVDVERRLQGAGVPAHAVMNATIVRDDAQLAHREHFVTTQHAQLGAVYVESVGYRFSHTRAAVGAIPALGGDGDWIAREILRRPPQQ
jgi:crotonobetainyl-CoA:carnitine CoA-transferase CaiB-like acyl-CoA transferase